jgi:hypothetical protein
MRTQKQVIEENIKALEAIFQWHEGIVLKEEQVEYLLGWTGWGFTKALLYNPYNDEEWITVAEGDKQLRPVITQLHDLLQDKLSEKAYKEVVASIKAAVLDSYYTPAVVVDTFMEIVQEYADIKTVYDPAAGGGVFALSAIQNIENLQKVTMYEKDMLTSKVLECIMSTLPAKNRYTVHNKGFEESDKSEDGQYDLVATNPPYGSFPVFDPTIPDKNLTGKVHNYFFAKGISKLRNNGLLAYLVTNAFLDTPTNRTARKYLFSNCDFISLTVMPDNLMKESANTEAPSHFLVVRRRYGKTEADMSEDEQLLCESSVQDIQGIKVAINNYVNSIYKTDDPARSITIATSVKPGKNQYGKPAVETWWDGPIDEIKEPFSAILRRDFDKRLGLSSTKLSTQTVFPVGKLEVVNPNTFKWVKDHIIVATIPKIEEPAVDDSYDENVMSDPSYYPVEDAWAERNRVREVPEHLAHYPVTIEEAYNRSVITENTISTLTGETLQLLCNNPALEYKIGTIISVTTGNQQNLFKEKKQLYKITATDSQGRPTAAELITDIKEGREQQIIELYLSVRNAYYELQKEEQ